MYIVHCAIHICMIYLCKCSLGCWLLIAKPLIFHSHFVEPLGLFHPSPPSLLDCTVCQQRRLCQEYPPGSQTGHENYGPSKFNLLFFLTGRITLITRRRKILLFCLFQIQILLKFMQNMKLLLDKVKRDSWTWRGDIFKLKIKWKLIQYTSTPLST